MTKKEVFDLLLMSNSHIFPIDGRPIGITKFQVFLALKPILKGKLYWEALINAYQMSDNLFQYRWDVRYCFNSQEPHRKYLMTKEEQMFLRHLPDKVMIYRGMTQAEKKDGFFGVSWTLKKEVAEYFCNDYGRNYDTRGKKNIVHQLLIDKKDIIALIQDRDEEEVIYINKMLVINYIVEKSQD